MSAQPAYKFWPGNNRFCCNGRCITGPVSDWPSNFCAWTALLSIATCWFVFAAPHLWKHVTPALPVIAALLLCSTVTFLLLTSCTDPGIIPRRSWQLLHGVVPEDVPEIPEMHGNQAPEEMALRVTPVFSEDAPARPPLNDSKWCTTCQITRPPRASHCSLCDNCVDNFDHHCPFVNQCIGGRNYPYFIGFLMSVTTLSVVAMVGFVFYAQAGSEGSGGASPVAAILVAVCLGLPTLVLTLVLLCFCSFHVLLMCSGETTRERLKGLRQRVLGDRAICGCVLSSRPSDLRLRQLVRTPERDLRFPVHIDGMPQQQGREAIAV